VTLAVIHDEGVLLVLAVGVETVRSGVGVEKSGPDCPGVRHVHVSPVAGTRIILFVLATYMIDGHGHMSMLPSVTTELVRGATPITVDRPGRWRRQP
jgi:hypothetical protein